MTGNLKAFLDMIAFAEIGTKLLAASDDGYNVLVGSTADRPYLFYDYDKHPRKFMKFSARITSSAAGRYQFLYDTWLALAERWNRFDMHPGTQDDMALELIREKDAIGDILAGRIEQAIWKCRKIWASFPGAGYGQGEKSLDDLLWAFRNAGGFVTGDY